MINRPIGLVGRVSGKPKFIPRSSHTKDSRLVLDIALLNTQHYKVRTKVKVDQSRERCSTLHYAVVAVQKGALKSSSITVTNSVLTLYPNPQ